MYTLDTHLSSADGERVFRVVGGEDVEVGGRPGHPVPGKARVSREEAQSHLQERFISLTLIWKQGSISRACIICHIVRFEDCATGLLRKLEIRSLYF